MRDGEIGVVESGAEPASSGVAGIACSGISGGDVIGNGTTKGLGAIPFGKVTAIASGVGRSKGVVAADVALRAGSNNTARCGNHLVSTSKRPAGGAVIEFSVRPSSDGMATGTSGSG